MKLKDAIKQRSFKSEYEKLMINVLYSGIWLTQKYDTLFKPYGLTRQQYNVLRILRGQHPHPVTITSIMERMLDKSSNASRIVDRLEVKQLATRQVSPQDRRAVDVRITQTGLDILAKLDHDLNQMERLFSALSEQEMETLNDLLDKLKS
jgi:DNA-binding MarR family transcriptional regulator